MMYTSLTTAINPRPFAPMPLGAKVAEVVTWSVFWGFALGTLFVGLTR